MSYVGSHPLPAAQRIGILRDLSLGLCMARALALFATRKFRPRVTLVGLRLPGFLIGLRLAFGEPSPMIHTWVLSNP